MYNITNERWELACNISNIPKTYQPPHDLEMCLNLECNAHLYELKFPSIGESVTVLSMLDWLVTTHGEVVLGAGGGWAKYAAIVGMDWNPVYGGDNLTEAIVRMVCSYSKD